MYNEVAEILIRNKMVKLPGVGVLLVDKKPATISAGERLIHAPLSQINFVEDSSIENEHTESNKDKNIFALGQQLASMQVHEKINIGHLGYFQKSNSGDYSFVQNEINYPALSSLPASRVIRKESVHEVTVGDTVRSSTEMHVHHDEPAASVKNNWWIFPLILAIISIALIVFYYFQPGHSDTFGLM